MKNGKKTGPTAAILDRLTGNGAYLEEKSGEMRRVPRETLPEGVREGDALIFADGKWQIDPKETQKRRELMKKRLERLLK